MGLLVCPGCGVDVTADDIACPECDRELTLMESTEPPQITAAAQAAEFRLPLMVAVAMMLGGGIALGVGLFGDYRTAHSTGLIPPPAQLLPVLGGAAAALLGFCWYVITRLRMLMQRRR